MTEADHSDPISTGQEPDLFDEALDDRSDDALSVEAHPGTERGGDMSGRSRLVD